LWAHTVAAFAYCNNYQYRVKAVSGAISSAYSNRFATSVTVPAAPSNLTGTASRQGNRNARITLTWTDNSNNETGFTIRRANDSLGISISMLPVSPPKSRGISEHEANFTWEAFGGSCIWKSAAEHA